MMGKQKASTKRRPGRKAAPKPVSRHLFDLRQPCELPVSAVSYPMKREEIDWERVDWSWALLNLALGHAVVFKVSIESVPHVVLSWVHANFGLRVTLRYDPMGQELWVTRSSLWDGPDMIEASVSLTGSPGHHHGG